MVVRGFAKPDRLWEVPYEYVAAMNAIPEAPASH